MRQQREVAGVVLDRPTHAARPHLWEAEVARRVACEPLARIAAAAPPWCIQSVAQSQQRRA